MDIGALIAGAIAVVAAFVGIVAGIVQVVEYLQKRRERKRAVESVAESPSARDISADDDHQPPALLETAEAAPPIPNNLPPRGEFIGREKEMARVRELLASRAFLVCIHGIGGIGKTVLALEVAHALLNEGACEGVVWTTAKDRNLALGDVLDTVARTLDYPGVAQQPLVEKQESVRRLLQAKPCLLVVDNFETVTDDAVRDFLLNLPEPSKALITSREQRLRQAAVVSLCGLEEGEALQFIRIEGRRLGLAAVEEAEDRVLQRLYQATGGAPLALKWAVGQIKQLGQSLDTVLTALHEARGDVFENMFARSWSLLTEEARRVLLVMPIFASSASRAAIEAASDVHHYALDEALGQLVQMSLVDASDELDAAKRRYSIHPLTRAFARARLKGNAELEQEARGRTARYFVQFAQANEVTPERRAGFLYLQTELPNLLSVAEWCYQAGLLVEFIKLVKAVDPFLTIYGYYDDRIRLGVMQTSAAQRVDDPRLAAEWAQLLGWTYYQQDALDDAESWSRKSLEFFKQLGDEWWIAIIERQLARVFRERGDYDESEHLLKHALATFEGMEVSPTGVFAAYDGSLAWWRTPYKSVEIAVTFRALGGLAYRKGNYGVARGYYEKSLEFLKAAGDKEGLHYSSYYLGMVAMKTGQLEEAQVLFQTSLAGAEKVWWADLEADARRGLALLMETRGEYQPALTQAREALAAYERRGMRRDIRETQALIERLEAKLAKGNEGSAL